MPIRGTYQQLMSRDLPPLLRQDVTLVDIRRPEEWHMTGFIAGSLLLTFFDAGERCQPESWLETLRRADPSRKPLVLICRTGHRTTLVCEMLVEMEVRDSIYNVTDGIFGWLAEGLPIVPFAGNRSS
jgi:rhodanese-related sulfurtransferase